MSTRTGSSGEITVDRRLDLPEKGDREEDVGLQDRNEDARHELGEEQKPARKRTDEEDPHRAEFPVVDHRQRRLQAVEELDHRDEARRHVDLVQDISVVRRNDRDAEDGPEPCREDEEPYERAHERRQEPAALVQKAQRLAPGDAGKADGIAGGAKAGHRAGAHSAASRLPKAPPDWPTSLRNASSTSAAPVR